LRYILDTHSEIWCPGELALGQLIRAMRFTLSRGVAAHSEASAEADRLTQQRTRETIGELLTAFAAGRGKYVWCDKTPANLQFLEDIEWAFPDARYICLYRQSLDVVHSCLEISRNGFMIELAPYVKRNPYNLSAAMLESWVEKTERLVALETRSRRAFRLYYEALVNDPTGTLRQLFKFLDVRCDDSLLGRVFTTPHDAGGGDPKIRSSVRIEQDRIGKGAAIDRAALLRIPPELLERRLNLHIELGYPV
jgi:hypothetical protein